MNRKTRRIQAKQQRSPLRLAHRAPEITNELAFELVASMVEDLAGSATMAHIMVAATRNTFDPGNPADVKTGLAVASTQLIEAIDAGRVGFADEESRQLLFLALVFGFELALDGKFAAGVEVHSEGSE